MICYFHLGFHMSILRCKDNVKSSDKEFSGRGRNEGSNRELTRRGMAYQQMVIKKQLIKII